MWKQFQPELILLCARWCLKYPLTYRNRVEMMAERGLSVLSTSIMRWVIQSSPIPDQRVREHLKITNDSRRLDETYRKIKGVNL